MGFGRFKEMSSDRTSVAQKQIYLFIFAGLEAVHGGRVKKLQITECTAGDYYNSPGKYCSGRKVQIQAHISDKAFKVLADFYSCSPYI